MKPPIILPDARKHGVEDEDMLHAYRNVLDVFEQDDGFTMLVGPARNGDLLDIGVIGSADLSGLLLIHAMRPARDKYLR